MPSPGDPAYDRQERAARARQAASGASDERLAELRAKYLAPAKAPTGSRATSSATPGAPVPRVPRAVRDKNAVDTGAIVRVARTALDKHPATWTSYAELCSAAGLTRSGAGIVARKVTFDPTGPHWFRVRDEDGVYNAPSGDADHQVDARFDPTEADQQLVEIGVAVIGGRADPLRKLYWTGNGWGLRETD